MGEFCVFVLEKPNASQEYASVFLYAVAFKRSGVSIFVVNN